GRGERTAGAGALLFHEPRELLLVHAEPALAGQLLRQLEREAVRVVEPERLLARNVPAFRRDLLEEPQPSLERLAEPLLLGAQDAVDLVSVLLVLSVALLHMLDLYVYQHCLVTGIVDYTHD